MRLVLPLVALAFSLAALALGRLFPGPEVEAFVTALGQILVLVAALPSALALFFVKEREARGVLAAISIGLSILCGGFLTTAGSRFEAWALYSAGGYRLAPRRRLSWQEREGKEAYLVTISYPATMDADPPLHRLVMDMGVPTQRGAYLEIRTAFPAAATPQLFPPGTYECASRPLRVGLVVEGVPLPKDLHDQVGSLLCRSLKVEPLP